MGWGNNYYTPDFGGFSCLLSLPPEFLELLFDTY